MSLGGYLGGGAGDRPNLRRFGIFFLFLYPRVVILFFFSRRGGLVACALVRGLGVGHGMNGSSSFFPLCF